MKFIYSHRTQSSDGQYVHIRELTDALKARGHALVMAGPGGAREEAGKPLDAGESGSLRARLPGFVYECAEYGYSFPAYRRLKSLSAQHQPDLIYERYNLFYHSGVWLKRRTGAPLILEVNAPLADERARYGDLALKGLAKRSEQSIWRAADMVLPVTNVLADKVRAAGVPDEKICVIQNGVSETFLKPQDRTLGGAEVRARYGLQDKLVLGFSGFIRDWHGVDRAIEFIAGNPNSNTALLVVGDGPALADLKLRVEVLGVSKRVVFSGIVQRDAIAEHIAAFDIALQPAVVDYASPLKLFEYMALGKAIVAPASPNIREVLTDGANALLFAQDERVAFDSALSKLVEDPDLRRRIGAAARAELIERDYSWAGNARRVEDIAARLLENRA